MKFKPLAKTIYQDLEIIQSLLLGNKKQERETLQFVYSEFKPLITSILLQRYHASQAEIDDVFQEAILELYLSITRRKFKQEYSIKSFLVTVSKRRWFDKFDHDQVRQRHAEEEQNDPPRMALPDRGLISEEKQRLFGTLLAKLKQNCRDLLGYRWFQGYRMEEIMTKMGLSSNQMARNHHVKCKNHLKQLIEANPEIKNLVLEII